MIIDSIISTALNNHVYPETPEKVLLKIAGRFKNCPEEDLKDTEEDVNSWTDYISVSVFKKRIVLRFIKTIKTIKNI